MKKPKGVAGHPENPLAAYYNQLDLKRKLHEKYNQLIRKYNKLEMAAQDALTCLENNFKYMDKEEVIENLKTILQKEESIS